MSIVEIFLTIHWSFSRDVFWGIYVLAQRNVIAFGLPSCLNQIVLNKLHNEEFFIISTV